MEYRLLKDFNVKTRNGVMTIKKGSLLEFRGEQQGRWIFLSEGGAQGPVMVVMLPEEVKETVEQVK